METNVCNTRLLSFFDQTLHLKDLLHAREFVLLCWELIKSRSGLSSAQGILGRCAHRGQTSPGDTKGCQVWLLLSGL